MSLFFAGANNNQSLILETFGIPIIAFKKKAYVPYPCCQNARRFKTGKSNIKFESEVFESADGKKISVNCSATYSIDTSTRGAIMKAYKSYRQSDQKFVSRINSKESDLETDVEAGIKEIITTLLTNKLKLMEYNEIVKIDLIFINKVFEEGKSELQPNKVELRSIQLHGIKENKDKRGGMIIDVTDNVETKRENGYDEHDGGVVLSTGKDKSQVETSCISDINVDKITDETPTDNTADYSALRLHIETPACVTDTAIPECNTSTKMHTDNTDIHMNAKDVDVADKTAEIKAIPEIHIHIKPQVYIQMYIVTTANTEVNKEKVVDVAKTVAELTVLPEIEADIECNKYIDIHAVTTKPLVRREEEIAVSESFEEVESIPKVHTHFKPNTSIQVYDITTEIELENEEDIAVNETVVGAEALSKFDTDIEGNTSIEIHTDTTETQVKTQEEITVSEIVAEVKSLPEEHAQIQSNISNQMHAFITDIELSKENDIPVAETVANVQLSPSTEKEYIEIQIFDGDKYYNDFVIV